MTTNLSTSNSRLNLLNFLLLLIASLLTLLPSLAFPQNQIESDQLKYYLIQAFNSPQSSDRLELNHIGIQSTAVSDGHLVSAVLEGYPAHAAEIRRGDVIQSADGAAFHPFKSFNQIDPSSNKISKSSSVYALTVRRNDTLLNIQISTVYENLYDSYRTASLNSVQEFPVGNKVIGYIRLWGFSRSSNDLISFQRLINNLQSNDGLIIDLRDSFGFLDIAHLDIFSNSRQNYFEVSGQTTVHSHLDYSKPRINKGKYLKPVAVLINSNTRGGSELFALQMAKLERIVSIGEATEGAIGSYLINPDLDTSSILYVPAMETLIDSAVLESRGLVPEQNVEYPYTQTTRSDPQYEAAVVTLLGII